MITFGPGWQIMDPFFRFCQISKGPVHETWKTTKHYFKSDPAIQTACQKEAYPKSFINIGQPQAKWIHDLPTWPKGDHDIFVQVNVYKIYIDYYQTKKKSLKKSTCLR